MIAAIVLAAVSATASPAPNVNSRSLPSPAASKSLTLPRIERALELPYPAYGSAQPQVIITRRAADVPTAISMDAAIAIAIDRVPTLSAARAQVALEDAAVLSARTADAPSVSIAASSSGSYSQAGAATGTATTTTTATAAGPLSTYSQTNKASLSLSQLIFDGGQVRAKIDAANLTRDATLATFRRDAQTVAYDVSSAYYAVLQDERAVAVDEQLLEQDVVSENLVRAQIAAGVVAGAELSTQLATTASARTTLVQAQGTLQNDRVSFATTLGLDADIDVLPIDDTRGLESATPVTMVPAFASALDIAYAERPDYDQAKLTIASSRASLRAARRGLSPSLSFVGSKGTGSSNGTGGAWRNDGSLGLDITIPVYDQGITRANVASSRASLDLASADAANTKLTVQRDVRQALIAIVSDRATLDSSRAAYASAVASLASTQGQYRAGVSTLPSLIQAEGTLATAATNIVNAIYALRLSQSNLRYALGTILQ